MTEKMAKRRVKLYTLNAERQWDDRGTGHVTSTYVERLKGMSLLVKAENDGALLLESKILPDTAYQRQQGTLIVWSEGESYDLALSFQEKVGCEEIWEKICQVQGKDPAVDITQELVEESEDDRYDDNAENTEVELPLCEVSNLEEINETISSCMPSTVRKEKLAAILDNEGYIKKLINAFHICEDSRNMQGLHHLYEIFKQIFHLNKNNLFDLMFSEDMIFHVVGALEYDPSCAYPKRHRQYLKSVAKFREVIPIDNKELLSKIHQTYRVQFIQDVVLPTPQVFEENILSTLSSFIFFNKVEIVNIIQDDEKLLTDLFDQLSKGEDELPIEKRRELVLFLKEFCTFSQTLQPIGRENFFKTLSSLGVLPVVEIALCLDDPATKAATIDILTFIVEFSPSIVREYMLQQQAHVEEDQYLINIIIEQMVLDVDPEMGGAAQLIGILRILIDPDNMLTNAAKSERPDFLTFIYKHSMNFLTDPLFSNTVGNEVGKKDYQTAQLLALIIELLTFCVEHHLYHIKYYIVQKQLLTRILVLLKSKHTFLALCALRFMRKIIGLKDDCYNRHIICERLFGPVVEALERNNGRYNLFDSAIVELFEYIKNEEMKGLCTHIVELYDDVLSKVDYVQTFKNLKRVLTSDGTEKKEKPHIEGLPVAHVRGTNGSVSDIDLESGKYEGDMDGDDEAWMNAAEELRMVEFDEIDDTPPTDVMPVNIKDIFRTNPQVGVSEEVPDISVKSTCPELTTPSDSLPITEFSVNSLKNDSAFNVSNKENHLNCSIKENKEKNKSPVPVENINSPVLTNRKVSLVDYDENSDEDELMDDENKDIDMEDMEKPSKRPRLEAD